MEQESKLQQGRGAGKRRTRQSPFLGWELSPADMGVSVRLRQECQKKAWLDQLPDPGTLRRQQAHL